MEEYLISKSLDSILQRVNSMLSNDKGKFIISKKNIEDALAFHATQVENWSSEITFKDLQNPKSTSQVYIKLDVYLTPNRQKISKEDTKKVQIIDILRQTNRNLVILGQPGAGKTTTMKHICQLMYHKDGINENLNIPIVIRLRELVKLPESRVETLLERIFETIGLNIIIEKKVKKDKKYELVQKPIRKSELYQYEKIVVRIISEILDELGVCLILDGLDELPANAREKTIQEVRELCLSLTKAKIILTSRIGEFHYNIENTSEYEICPLNTEQMEQFSKKWLQSEESGKFIEQLKKSPFADTAMRPLTMAHLLAIYEREKQIPEKPKTVYRKIVNLLLDEWDLQRSIKRKSRYGNFETDRKQEFLANMSYYLTLNFNRTIFSKSEFEITYKNICENFDLPKYESKKVVDELESHNGLFMQTGYEEYEFAHKSLQEFLCADYLVKLPFIPLERELLRIPNELALCMAISSNPTNYFVTLVFHILDNFEVTSDFIEVLFNRIIIEKIDFNQHPLLGLAFLQLFTKQIKQKKTQLGPITDIYIKLHNLSSFKSSLVKLNEYFKVNENFDGSDILFEIENSKYLSNPIINTIPKNLIAHQDFLYNWE